MCQNFVLANKSTVSLINNLVWHLHSVYMYIFSIHGNAMWIGTKKEHIASDLTIQRWQVKNTHNKIMWHENLRRIFFVSLQKKSPYFIWDVGLTIFFLLPTHVTQSFVHPLILTWFELMLAKNRISAERMKQELPRIQWNKSKRIELGRKKHQRRNKWKVLEQI